MTAKPNYAAYVINLAKKDASPFKPKSDEEVVEKEKLKNDKSKKDDENEDSKKKSEDKF